MYFLRDIFLEDIPLRDVRLKDVFLNYVFLEDALLKDALLKEVLLKDVLLKDVHLRDVLLKDVLSRDLHRDPYQGDIFFEKPSRCSLKMHLLLVKKKEPKTIEYLLFIVRYTVIVIGTVVISVVKRK